MCNLLHGFDIYLVNVKTMRKIAQIFVAFSEKLNFKKNAFKSTSRECVSTGAVGAQTRRSLRHHLLHPLILRLLVQLVLFAPTVLKPRALQDDAPAPADPNS